jgi:hypothetical protein
MLGCLPVDVNAWQLHRLVEVCHDRNAAGHTPITTCRPHLVLSGPRCRCRGTKASSSVAAYVSAIPVIRRVLTNDGQQSQGEVVEPKKARHGRLSPAAPSRLKQGQLPSPVTQKESTASSAADGFKEGTATPPPQARAVRSPRGPAGLSSPPSDTQAFSQFVYPPESRTYAVADEEGEDVWGYLVPIDDHSGKVMVLRRRDACPVPQALVGQASGHDCVPRREFTRQEEHYEEEKTEHGINAGGYLIGRHRECGTLRRR